MTLIVSILMMVALFIIQFNKVKQGEDISRNLEHISYEIERQEQVLRRHIILEGLFSDGETAGKNGETKTAEPVGLFKFAQNRNYYDSLESVEVLRNKQPIHQRDIPDDESEI